MSSEEEIRTEFNKAGFAVFKNILTKDEINALRAPVMKHYNKGIVNANGISIPDYLSKKEFQSMQFLLNHPKIHQALSIIFNNQTYRFCSHNDIGIDRVVGWHKDKLNGEYSKFQKTNIWKPNNKGEKHEIVKVLIYLQDHSNDNHGLQLIYGSHTDPEIKQDKSKLLQMHPELGDIIIFDQRLTHRGQEVKTNSFRILVTLGFGRPNVFTDEFEKGTVARQRTQSSQCKF